MSPRDRARTLRSLTSLGDKTPSEMLHYMRSLLPGYPDNPLFEAIFLDLLPANARDAAVKHEVLEDMADAADKVLAEAPTTVSEISATCDESPGVSRVFRPTSAVKKTKDICFVHARYGQGAWKCSSPKTCKMKDVISKPSPNTSSTASGNVNAGRQ